MTIDSIEMLAELCDLEGRAEQAAEMARDALQEFRKFQDKVAGAGPATIERSRSEIVDVLESIPKELEQEGRPSEELEAVGYVRSILLQAVRIEPKMSGANELRGGSGLRMRDLLACLYLLDAAAGRDWADDLRLNESSRRKARRIADEVELADLEDLKGQGD